MTPDRHADRARVYRALARVFQSPRVELLAALRAEDAPELRDALARLGAGPELLQQAEALAAELRSADAERLGREYEGTFEPSSGPRCAPNETAHAPESPQEALVRTFELADIAGFYRAFGVEIEPESERVDHLAAELEFMHLLAVKEALAGTRGETEHAEVCREAATAFLRDHLARFVPKLCARLEETEPGPVYANAGRLLAGFVELDSAPSLPS